MSDDEFFKIRGKQAPLEVRDEEKKTTRPHGPPPKSDFAKILAKQEKEEGQEQNLIEGEGNQEKVQKKPTPESLLQKIAKEGHDPRTNQPPALVKESKVPPRLGSGIIDAPSDEPRSKPFVEAAAIGEKTRSFATETQKEPPLFPVEDPQKSSKAPVLIQKLAEAEGKEKTGLSGKEPSEKTLSPIRQEALKERTPPTVTPLDHSQELQGKGGINLEEQKKQLEAGEKLFTKNAQPKLSFKTGQEETGIQIKESKSETLVEATQKKEDVQKGDKEKVPLASVFTFNDQASISSSPIIPTVQVPRPEMVLELIRTLAAEIQTQKTPENTTAVLTIHKEGLFQGAEISITSFAHARGEVNIQVANLTQEAKSLLDQNTHLLKQALDEKGVIVHMLVTTTAPNNQIASQNPNFRDQREEGERQQRQQQERENQEEEQNT